ncbi:MAG: delta-60 repeat domain-containing protein [Bdellovibrionota bacterium]|nr:MAG: delta-60 repeat domain-containing protein [Bdellovibrionota bacterium]
MPGRTEFMPLFNRHALIVLAIALVCQLLMAPALMAQCLGTRQLLDMELDGAFGLNGERTEVENFLVRGTVVGPAGSTFVFGEYVFLIDNSRDLRLIGAAVRKLKSNGDPDESFGDNGLVLLPYHAPDARTDVVVRGVDLTVDQNGRVIISAGVHALRSPVKLVLTRLLESGGYDSSFGQGGMATLAFPQHSGDAYTTVVRALSLGDSSLYVLGIELLGGSFLLQFHEDGSQNVDFGQQGFVELSGNTTPPELLGVEPSDIEPLAPHYFLLAGGDRVAKFTAAGRLVEEFGVRGVWIAPRIEGHSSSDIKDLVVDANGEIIVTGSVTVNYRPDGGVQGTQAYLARLHEDGTSDTSFAGTGYQLYSFAPLGLTSWEFPRSVHILNSGDYLVAGGYSRISSGDWPNSDGTAALAKIDKHGALDTTFANAGVQLLGSERIAQRSPQGRASLQHNKLLLPFYGEQDGILMRLTASCEEPSITPTPQPTPTPEPEAVQLSLTNSRTKAVERGGIFRKLRVRFSLTPWDVIEKVMVRVSSKKSQIEYAPVLRSVTGSVGNFRTTLRARKPMTPRKLRAATLSVVVQARSGLIFQSTGTNRVVIPLPKRRK